MMRKKRSGMPIGRAGVWLLISLLLTIGLILPADTVGAFAFVVKTDDATKAAVEAADEVRSVSPHQPGYCVAPSRDPDRFEIGLQSRQFTPQPGISSEVRAALEDRGGEALAQGVAKIHTILQLDYIPTPEQKEQLRQQGIELLTYIPNYAWLAAIPATNPAQVAGTPGVRWVGSLTVQDKLQPELQAQELEPWAYDPASNLIALLVQFYRDVSLEQGSTVVEAHGGQVIDQVASINTLVVHLHKDKVAALAAEDAVEWIEQPLPLLEPINDGNRARVGADTLQAAPYSLDGTDVDVLIYDGGRVYTHDDLDSKRTWGDTSPFAEHATHVACTVLGDGSVNSTYRGMAPNAELLSMGFECGNTGLFLYTNPGDIQNDLDYAKNTWPPSADLFNASIGTNTAPNGFPCSLEGNYGATAQLVDAIVRGSLGEPLIAAWASGNERGGTARCGSTYRTTAPPACAKNPIHSGATDSIDDSMSSFSSWGPCDDGRLKPTISSPGVSVMSCDDSNSYTSMSGTSMASPTTAGVIALMLEQYRATYSTSGEFLPSTVKALLMHTAVDLGNTGPDYQFGYGRIDGVAAVDTIIARDFREETTTAHGQIDEYTITVSGSPSELRASLAWDDPTGSLAAIKKLVNDLDLELEAPDSTIYYPWVLDPSNPGSSATPGVDDINNQEQVVVNSPMNGTWTVRVKGTTVPDAPQDYSLVFPGADTAPKTTTPGGGPPGPPPTSCSEALTNGGFESGTSPWVWSGSATQSSTYAHSGTYSGRVGGTSDGYFYQQIALPSGFYSGTLTYWVRMNTSETSHPWDFFDAEIRDGSNNILTTLQSLNDGDSDYQGTWRQETFTLGSEYAGQTIRLRFEADVDSSISTYWYVDDVSLDACIATGGNTPPVISDLPDQMVPKNGSADNAIDLWVYASDAQDSDSDLTFTISNSPDSNAGVTIDSNRYIDINPVPDWTGTTDVEVQVEDTGSLIDTDSFQVTVGFPSPPFCDGFESGSLGTVWTTYTTNEGRVQVSSSYPYSGTYSVLLDDSTINSTYSYAAIILTIDLSGQSQVELDFWWREFGDENHPDDGVFISDDNGVNWYQALSFNNGPSSYRNDVIDIDSAAAANGLTLNDHFQIKFQFYDNYSITSDGYAIDEVCVQVPSLPDIGVSPASFEETVHEGGRVTKTLTISNTGTDSLTFSISEEPGSFTPLVLLDGHGLAQSLDETGNLPQELLLSPIVPLDLGNVVNSFSAPASGFIGLEWIYGYLWAASSSNSMLYKLDPVSGAVLDTVSVPGLSTAGLAWDGSAFWVTDTGADIIAKVNTSGAVLLTFPAPSSGPAGLAWDGAYLWDVDWVSDELHKIDPSSGAVLHTIPSPDTRPAGVAWDGQYLWTNGRNSATTYKLDPTDGSVVSSFSTPPGAGFNNGQGAAFDGQYLWVANIDVQMIYQIDIEHVAPDVPWLSEEPTSGTVSAGGSLPVDVVFDTTGLALGDYTADLVIYNNDPDENPVTVPVVMHVTDNNPPNTPSSPSPTDGATNQDINVDLGWTGGDPDAGDTVTYDVYFEADDSDPDNLICNDVSTPACDPGTLDYGTHYYWYVVATDNHSASTTGDTWDFYTICPTPSAPSLSSPPNASETDDTTPTFSWGSVSGATSYRILVDDDSGFSSPEVDQTISSTSYTPGSELPDGDTYYWRVWASNSCGSGPWSAVWEFAISAQSPWVAWIYLPAVVRGYP